VTNPSGGPTDRKVPDQTELLKQIVDSATGFAIFTIDPTGITTTWNVGAERMLGYTEAEILGQSSDVIFVSEDRAAGVPDRERNKARAEGRAEDERWHVRKDGSLLWGSGLLMPLTDGRAGFVKILRDLTAHHAAEKQLRENEERFRVLATNIPQLVFRSRPTGERTWGSPQWIEFTGLNLDQSLQFGWLDAIHPDDRKLTLNGWKAAQETGEYYVEHRIRRSPDGEYRWHQTRARPIGSGEGAADDWVGTSSDVHDLRGLQERQKVLLAELLHRTRNLLAVVQSIARKTARGSSSLPAFEVEFGDRLGALGRVQGMLARAEDQVIDLRALVEGELIAHGDSRDEPGKVQIEGPMTPVPMASAQALALALHELATNAVKYGALGQSAGRLAVTWRIEERGEPRIVLDWTEHGVTLPEEAPMRKGYGRELIERALPYQLKTETRFEFADDGVHCQITMPIAAAEEAGSHG